MPSPLTSEARSISYQVLTDTEPKEAITAASPAGASFQVTVVSLQVASAARWKSPPFPDGSMAYSRSLALVGCRSFSPVTVNLSRKSFCGLPSTCSEVANPKLARGISARTYASSVGVKMRISSSETVGVGVAIGVDAAVGVGVGIPVGSGVPAGSNHSTTSVGRLLAASLELWETLSEDGVTR